MLVRFILHRPEAPVLGQCVFSHRPEAPVLGDPPAPPVYGPQHRLFTAVQEVRDQRPPALPAVFLSQKSMLHPGEVQAASSISWAMHNT